MEDSPDVIEKFDEGGARTSDEIIKSLNNSK